MCFLFHKWEKWSEVKIKRKKRVVYERQCEQIEFIERYQSRKCLKCDMYQERTINKDTDS